jgi:hypothetical protein
MIFHNGGESAHPATGPKGQNLGTASIATEEPGNPTRDPSAYATAYSSFLESR